MKTMEEKKYNHIELNNEVTKRREDGFFSLEKDQEASFFLISVDTIEIDTDLKKSSDIY